MKEIIQITRIAYSITVLSFRGRSAATWIPSHVFNADSRIQRPILLQFLCWQINQRQKWKKKDTADEKLYNEVKTVLRDLLLEFALIWTLFLICTCVVSLTTVKSKWVKRILSLKVLLSGGLGCSCIWLAAAFSHPHCHWIKSSLPYNE